MARVKVIAVRGDTPIGFPRGNSIFDVPHGPGWAFSRAIFRMLIFLAGPDLGGGGTILDGVAKLEPAFALFATGFFDTLVFHFLIATYEDSESGRGRGAKGTPICSRTQFK
jgi:hypothetical protein